MRTLRVTMDADRTVLVRRPVVPSTVVRPTPAAVAGPNPACTEAGREVAEHGGNAVDVAIAAVLVALVNEPGVASLGGGAYLTVAPPQGDPVTVDGSVAMPGKGLPATAFGRGLRRVEMSYGGGVQMETGHGSVATPGALTAFELAQERFGRLPWADVVAPAARLARAGFPLSRTASTYLQAALGPVFGEDADALSALSGPDGRPRAAGDVVRLPGLADFLDLVAAEGAAALHRGEVARRLAADMAGHGGLITEADLASYRPVVRPAMRVRAGAWNWATNPPPSVGGSVLGALLLLFEELLAAGEPVGTSSPAGLARLVEVQRAVLSYRVREIDIAPDRQRAAAALIDGVLGRGLRWLPTSPSTVHVSAVDADGTACAVTASSGYGAGVSVPGTGVWLNNCLGERELNRRGLHALAPGERVVSNMAPTVGRHDDGTVLAIGSPGADRIASAIAQVVLRLVEGSSLSAAIEAPRVHVTCADDGRPVRVEHEADVASPFATPGASSGASPDLEWREHPRLSMFFGGVAAAARTAEGLLEAAADPRREGAVAVLP